MTMTKSFAGLPTFDRESGDALAVIETPKGSRNKYSYNETLEIFELRKVLPRGMIFPYDFGFLPSTRGEDGDPLDILLLLDAQRRPAASSGPALSERSRPSNPKTVRSGYRTTGFSGLRRMPNCMET
jgi:hypothetical protein